MIWRWWAPKSWTTIYLDLMLYAAQLYQHFTPEFRRTDCQDCPGSVNVTLPNRYTPPQDQRLIGEVVKLKFHVISSYVLYHIKKIRRRIPKHSKHTLCPFGANCLHLFWLHAMLFSNHSHLDTRIRKLCCCKESRIRWSPGGSERIKGKSSKMFRDPAESVWRFFGNFERFLINPCHFATRSFLL